MNCSKCGEAFDEKPVSATGICKPCKQRRKDSLGRRQRNKAKIRDNEKNIVAMTNRLKNEPKVVGWHKSCQEMLDTNGVCPVCLQANDNDHGRRCNLCILIDAHSGDGSFGQSVDHDPSVKEEVRQFNQKVRSRRPNTGIDGTSH